MTRGSDSEVEDIEIRLLLEGIHARYGYDFRHYAMSSMRRRVIAALARSRLSDLGALQHRILTDSDFFAETLDCLTVRVTEMFRDPPFYRAFRAQVVPVLRTYPLLKFWHAGCSTGEEVYATTILLTEEGLYDRTQIYATDLSVTALEHAKEGLYPSSELALYAKNHAEAGGTEEFSTYYTERYDHLAIKDALKRNVLFFHHDLVSDHVFGDMNVIFCRNVLIYFDRELKARVLTKLRDSLRPGGAYLCLGRGEPLLSHGRSQAFTEIAKGARIYRYDELPK